MLKATVRIPKSSMDKLKRIIEAKCVQVLEEVSLKTYNYIVGPSEHPYFSGSYIASWNISVGSMDSSYKQPMMQRGVYKSPNLKFDLNIQNPYQAVYITNSAPHAAQVELEGTPTHEYPWMVAASARNATLMSYRFF